MALHGLRTVNGQIPRKTVGMSGGALLYGGKPMRQHLQT